MDLFRRKKKVSLPTSSSQEDPPAAPNEKQQRKQKRHSLGDIGLTSLWNSKKQKDLELPLRPHARSVIPVPNPKPSNEDPVRLSKRRAPGPPRSSPKRHSLASGLERRIMANSSIAKTTVCSTEVFHDSHIGHEVTSPASSVRLRTVPIYPQRKGPTSISSFGSSNSVFVPSPAGSVIHETAIYRKPLTRAAPSSSKPIDIQQVPQSDVARSLPCHFPEEEMTREDEVKPEREDIHEAQTIDLRKRSHSTDDLPLISECSPSLYAEAPTSNFTLQPRAPTPEIDYDQDDTPKTDESDAKADIPTGFLSQPVYKWTSGNVVDWCKLKGFNDYAELFEGEIPNLN